MASNITRRLALLLVSVAAWAAVTTPQEHFGFTPGDEHKLANYGQIRRYFEKLAAGSDRIRLFTFGKTSDGRDMFYAVISSAENLKRLDEYKQLNRRLALGQATPQEAEDLARRGKAIVWIDSSMHATEVAPAQHSPDLAYQMVTGESDEMKRIRDKVILVQIPVTNPDGLDYVSEWYAKNVGTPYELSSPPKLYQKYVGHDNNRDYFMMNLPETRNISQLLFDEWFPQIVFNQHQAPAFPARIFVPPYAEPLNPNIPPPVMEGINVIGAAMRERFARENKPGVLSYFGFDAWWNGGLRSVPAFHNMHGILTEVALYGAASTKDYKLSELPDRFANGVPTKQPSVFYERPWLGGKWGTRNSIDYLLTADMAILDLASSRSQQFLFKAWEMARQNIDSKSGAYAYVVGKDQFDPSVVPELMSRLKLGGVEVKRALAGFQAGGKTYAEGSYVLLAAQPFRGYLVDLMEPQQYPEIRLGSASGPVKRPYDIAGWTLPYSMGVKVDRIEQPFTARLEDAATIPPHQATLDRKETASFRALASQLKSNQPVRMAADGSFLTGQTGTAAYELQTPRVAIYEPHFPNMDAGWTQWLFDNFGVPFTVIRNADFQQGNLRQRFDSIILADQNPDSILHGIRAGERVGSRNGDGPLQTRPEFTGGIGLKGLANLQEFVRGGGTLITFDSASALPVEHFPLPVRMLVPQRGEEGGGSASGFFSPGSQLRITVDNQQPLAFGMPGESIAFVSGGQAFESKLLPEFNRGDQQVTSIVKFASKDLLASGYVSGEKAVVGKDALVEARHGQGRVVLFGFRPQFRGQTFGTFKLLLNAVYLASAKKL